MHQYVIRVSTIMAVVVLYSKEKYFCNAKDILGTEAVTNLSFNADGIGISSEYKYTASESHTDIKKRTDTIRYRVKVRTSSYPLVSEEEIIMQ